MGRVVYLVPYVHLPLSAFVEKYAEQYVEVFERMQYPKYIGKIASAIKELRPQRVYTEGVKIGHTNLERGRASDQVEKLAKYSLEVILLENGLSLYGMEDVKIHRAHIKVLYRGHNTFKRLDEYRSESGLITKLLKLPFQRAIYEYLKFLSHYLTLLRDRKWARYVKTTLGENEKGVMIYGAEHHPEKHFSDEIEYRLLYEGLYKDAQNISNLFANELIF